MVFWGMDLLERIIKILQIPPSGCSRSSQSSDLLTDELGVCEESLLTDEERIVNECVDIWSRGGIY